jgi:tryptophan-rich sensory protein
MVIPLVIGLFYQTFTDESMSFRTFYDNFLINLDGKEIFVLIQTLVLLVDIWVIGGAAGRQIIDRNRPNFLTGGITFFLLWILLFTSSSLTAAIAKTIIWGKKGLNLP